MRRCRRRDRLSMLGGRPVSCSRCSSAVCVGCASLLSSASGSGGCRHGWPTGDGPRWDPIEGAKPESSARRVNPHDVNCVPWSLRITTLSAWWFSMAILSAFTTRLAVWDESIAQPTTRRENASSTTAQYTLPSRVRCSVMSVSHNRFGSVRAKSRFTRSSAVGVFGILRYFGRPGSPAKPRRRMISSTVQRATVMLRPRTSSTCTRRAP